MYREFRKDRAYLTRYHAYSAIILLAVAGTLVSLAPPKVEYLVATLPGLILLASTRLPLVMMGTAYLIGALIWRGEFEFWQLIFVPLSVAATLVATGLIHNASHDNIRPRWLRHPIGELCGFFHLVGFRDWVVVHTLHHAHADDPEYDPHPPLDKSYWRFTLGMRESIVKVLVQDYFKHWGQSPESTKKLWWMGKFAMLGHWSKIAIWWTLLPLSAFSLFFALSIALKMLHYAWFNYATHRKSSDGPTILNLDSPVYKVANALSFGLYFHKNHHSNPRLFDPRRLKSQDPALPLQEPRAEDRAA